MKIYIDFSIFDSSVTAFGNVTGYIEVPVLPKVGNEVHLFNDEASQSTLGISGRLRVEGIYPVEGYGPEYAVFSLEDVVMDSKEAAKKLANKLDVECGLFCDEYHG